MSGSNTESEKLSDGEHDWQDNVRFVSEMPREFYFPENTVLDLHDLVGILLHEYQQTETLLRHSQLIELVDGTRMPSCISHKDSKPWLEMRGRKVGYYLMDPEQIPPEDAPPVGPNEFLHPSFDPRRILDTEDVESIYWRVRLAIANRNGMVLYALQCILRAFPASATLRVRTSQGHSLTCLAQAFKIKGADAFYKEGLYIGRIESYIDESWLTPRRRTALKHHQQCDLEVSDEWLYMVFQGEGSRKNDVALDLASLVIGSRGLGGEIFSMEKEETYREKVLAEGLELYGNSDSDSDSEEQTYDRIDPPPAMDDSKIMRDIAVINRVLRRLVGIYQGKEVFCSYCGRPQAPSRCSKCAVSRYCGQACQKKAWKYHKVWCKVDAVKSTDSEMHAPSTSNPDVERIGKYNM